MHVIDSYKNLPKKFYHENKPTEFDLAQFIKLNHDLLNELDVTLNEEELLHCFSGSKSMQGYTAKSLAYSGHQFGYFNPSLGDGRAHIIAEVISKNSQHFDIQLKGSGRSQFSRNGDGLSTLGPVLREFLVSEFMHQLGVPSTRSLAAIATNEKVYREDELAGGVLVRVANSHIRVGSFEYFYARGDFDALNELYQYVQKRHYSNLNTEMDVFKAIAKRKVELVTKWLGVGFIHGVMNTDNTSIAGITIDYGPCAFMDEFKKNKVFSSIDRQARYAYNNQMNIALWNLSVLANAMMPLFMKSSTETQVIEVLKEFFKDLEIYADELYLKYFAKKLGIFDPVKEDRKLIEDFLNILENESLDFTNSFRNLNTFNFSNNEWLNQWKERLKIQNKSDDEVIKLMDSVNPYLIARNHHIEEAINLAYEGDLSYFNFLNQAYSHPYIENKAYSKLTQAPTNEQRVYQTFCGT